MFFLYTSSFLTLCVTLQKIFFLLPLHSEMKLDCLQLSLKKKRA